MKKHILLFIVASTLVALLCGCSSQTNEKLQNDTYYNTPSHSITVKDGQYNLTPKTPLSDVDASMALVYPQFTSVEEMKQAIITGSFTEEELYALSLNSPSGDSGIEIYNLDHLYECTAPAEFSLENITWYGKYYVFALSCEKMWGGIDCYNEDEYTVKFANEYKDFLSNPNLTFIKQEEIEERSATVYYYNTDRAELKYICYDICIGNKKIYVQEEYVLEIKDDVLKESSDVPLRIEFWGTEHSGYFSGIFFDVKERPTVEWLCEFGITPYVALTN